MRRSEPQFKPIAFLLAGLGVLSVLISASAGVDSDTIGIAVAGQVIGYFLLACALIYTTVHAVGRMKRDHELWLREIDSTD